MVKLQLYITKSLRGYKSLINLNSSEEIFRHIKDVREALDVINYDPAEKNIFYLIRYVDEGTILSILRTIPNERLNHLSAAIFIPNGAVINAESLMQVVKLTTRKVSGSGVTAEDIAELREMFDREYNTYGETPAIASSEGHSYAVCCYGGDTGRNLIDFFGSRLFQPAFQTYAGVLLIDADLGLQTTGKDLTDIELRETIALNPPPETAEGFMPHIYGKSFDRPYLVPMGEAFVICWSRQGFEPMTREVTLTDDMRPIEPPDTSRCRKAILPSTFYITSRARRTPLTNCKIVVNDVEITEAHSFVYSELVAAKVNISCQGYMSFSGVIDLTATAQALIQLRDQRKVYRFEMPLKATDFGAPISFEIHSKRAITESPIDGYEANDTIREGAAHTNKLNFVAGDNHGGSRVAWIVAIVLSFVVGAVAGVYYCDGFNSHSLTHSLATTTADTVTATHVERVSDRLAVAEQQEIEPVAADTAAAEPAQAVENDAIKYLDGNRNWNRNDLERYHETAGLFDDMNGYQLENIINKWEPALKDSKSFAKVADAARQAIRKNKNPKRERHNPTYNAVSDSVIGWMGYCNWIDP
jgi:uncharacterized protein (UPF0248 family)